MSIFKCENSYIIKPLNGLILMIEGNISSGKSTLGNKLVEYFVLQGYNAKFYTEYRNDILLNQYISDMKKYAYSFQLFMLNKRIQIYKEAYEHSSKGGISIIDRSLFGDYVFCQYQVTQGNISEEEFNVYKSVIESEILVKPHIILYLECDVETCMKRIKKRGIQSEIDGYSEKYINGLDITYKTIFETLVLPYHKVIMIDNTKEFEISDLVGEITIRSTI